MTMLKKIQKIVALSLAMTLGLLTLCYCTPSIPSTPSEEPEPDPAPEGPGTETDDLPTILPTIAVAPNKATKLLLTKAVSGANGVTLGTLQGLAAKNSSTQILLRTQSWSLYLPYMQSAGATVSEKDENGKDWSLATFSAPRSRSASPFPCRVF